MLTEHSAVSYIIFHNSDCSLILIDLLPSYTTGLYLSMLNYISLDNHFINKYSLITYYALSTVPGTGDITQTRKSLNSKITVY